MSSYPIYKPVIKRRQQRLVTLNSTLGKRNFVSSFGKNCYENDRYGQPISDRFFEQNIGHSVLRPTPIHYPIHIVEQEQEEEKEIYEYKGIKLKKEDLIHLCHLYLSKNM